MTDISVESKPYNPSARQTGPLSLRTNGIDKPPRIRKIRVLLVITRLTIGGDTHVVLDLASRLDPDIFEIELAVGPVPDDEVDLTHLAFERGITVRLIPNLINHINPVTNTKALLELRAVISEGKFDIVHTHSSVAGVVGRLAAASARVPVIVHHIHGWGLREAMPWPMRFLYLNLERLCARFTKRMIAVSRPTIQKGLDHRICRADKFALIYNGIHLEDFRLQFDPRPFYAELGLNPDLRTVGMIGRLDAQKNPLDFIRAASMIARRYAGVQFVIAGEGRLRTDCEQLIRELNLGDKFFLLGFRNDVNRILRILDVVVSTSLWEGLPVVFQEAMSAGKPIVANSVDGAGDVLMDGITGYLVTPHEPQQVAERTLELLSNDELRSRMGLAARQYSERFASKYMLEQIGSLYKDLVAAQHPKEYAATA